MISTLKKQLLMLALVAGIVAPISAMDSNTESSGWFGWKTASGITVVVCVGGLLAYKWLTQKTTQLSVDDFVDLGQEAPKVEATIPEQEIDYKAEQTRLDKDIATLEREIREEEAAKTKLVATGNKTKRPVGQKGRAKPARIKPQVKAEEPELVLDQAVVEQPSPAEQPIEIKGKKVQGIGYGVSMGDLKKTQLKKTVRK